MGGACLWIDNKLQSDRSLAGLMKKLILIRFELASWSPFSPGLPHTRWLSYGLRSRSPNAPNQN